MADDDVLRAERVLERHQNPHSTELAALRERVVVLEELLRCLLRNRPSLHDFTWFSHYYPEATRNVDGAAPTYLKDMLEQARKGR